MRIELDQNEVATIVVNWAKATYKTHNISIDAIKGGSITMLVTSDSSLGELPSARLAPSQEELIAKLQALHGDAGVTEPELPSIDNEPLV